MFYLFGNILADRPGDVDTDSLWNFLVGVDAVFLGNVGTLGNVDGVGNLVGNLDAGGNDDVAALGDVTVAGSVSLVKAVNNTVTMSMTVLRADLRNIVKKIIST